jgi:hypothetical protein
VEELYTLSGGRWGMVISQVEPGTLEHQQGARLAVTVYCDDKPFAGYAYTESRRGEGACVDGITGEDPDLVEFVLSERDVQSLEFLLARVHQFVRDLSKSPGGAERPNSAICRNEEEQYKSDSRSGRSATTT